MTTIKSHTDLQQSKKLAEILPLESADMHSEAKDIDGDMVFIVVSGLGDKTKSNYGSPVWSLAALLDALPQSITAYIESERCQRTFHLNLFRSYYYCCSYSFTSSISGDDGDNTLHCIGRDNWVDACYEMILKLHELDLL